MTINNSSTYILYTFLTIIIMFAYIQFTSYDNDNENSNDNKKSNINVNYRKICKYLITNSSVLHQSKPMLWIHIIYEKNSRKWENFGSRSSSDLNQSYQYLTIKSILDKCGNTFNICVIDDDTFTTIIPGWTTDLNYVSEPIKGKIRQLALAKLLYYYGGIIVPSSFLCKRDLYHTYKEYVKNDTVFVCERNTRSINSSVDRLSPNPLFMGCTKDNSKMFEFIRFLESYISSDFTAEGICLDKISSWWVNPVKMGEANMIPAGYLGMVDSANNIITLDTLMNDSFINFSDEALGVYIPSDEILSRTAYQWFAALSAKEVLMVENSLGKLLLLSQ